MTDTVVRRGVRYFDTAPHYGVGLSEERLGTFLREGPHAANSTTRERSAPSASV